MTDNSSVCYQVKIKQKYTVVKKREYYIILILLKWPQGITVDRFRVMNH